MDEVKYCERCGFVGHVLIRKKCKTCNIKLKELSEDLKLKYHIFIEDWAKTSDEEAIARVNSFVMNELSDNPNFSMEEYEKQIQAQRDINKRIAEQEQKQILERQAKIIAHMQNESDKKNCIPQCPVCGSTNIEKISLTKKALGGAMFGLFSSDIRNTMKCKNCGAKW